MPYRSLEGRETRGSAVVEADATAVGRMTQKPTGRALAV